MRSALKWCVRENYISTDFRAMNYKAKCDFGRNFRKLQNISKLHEMNTKQLIEKVSTRAY